MSNTTITLNDFKGTGRILIWHLMCKQAWSWSWISFLEFPHSGLSQVVQHCVQIGGIGNRCHVTEWHKNITSGKSNKLCFIHRKRCTMQLKLVQTIGHTTLTTMIVRKSIRNCFRSGEMFWFNAYHRESLHFWYQKRNHLILVVFYEG